MTTTITVTIYSHKCLRCGHEWPSPLEVPKACLKCTSTQWQTVARPYIKMAKHPQLGRCLACNRAFKWRRGVVLLRDARCPGCAGPLSSPHPRSPRVVTERIEAKELIREGVQDGD